MPPVNPQPSQGKLYWRSLDELADTEEFRDFVYREFPAGATEMLNSGDRRQFLKIMGASLALAGIGMSGCRRWPDEKIAPFAHRPAGRAPGVAVHYATAMEVRGVGAGLLVTSFDGRPTKIEGNPQHPMNMGGTDGYSQASVLDMYDPDRSRWPAKGGKKSDWKAFQAWATEHFAKVRGGKGAGLAILSEATSSPSVQSMRKRLMEACPNAKWYEYEPLNNDNPIKGAKLAFGSAQRPHYQFDKARIIVSLDSDFLHAEPGSVKWTRDYAASRRAEKRDGGHELSMSRMYAFEACVSLTGANADHRVAMRSADVAIIAARLAAKFVGGSGSAVGEIASAEPQTNLPAAEIAKVLDAMVADLEAHKGASIIIAGERQPAEVHLLAHLLNEALGNVGKTVSYTAMPEVVAQGDSIAALAADIAAKTVETLVIIGGNPAYNAPADLKFADLIKSVPQSVHLSDYLDETSSACSWHVNRAHYLESWGDSRSYDGTVSICQPLIEPLFSGQSAIELLAMISGDVLSEGYHIAGRTFQELGFGNEAAWRSALNDGMVAKSAFVAGAAPNLVGQPLGQAMSSLKNRWSAAKSDELELVFTSDYSVLDGRYANNGWLQEMPDPMTKLTWDNAVLISPSVAKAKGLARGDMVTVRCNGREVSAAVMPMPGHFTGAATLALGYGRTMDSRIAKGAGFDFYPLRSSDAMGFASGGTIARASGSYVLATTQDHHAVDSIAQSAEGGEQQRLPTLFREGTLAEYREDATFVRERTHVVHRLSLWEEQFPFQSEEKFTGANYAWAMSIDLNACTGCNACVMACQAENNIPVVGKDQVKRSREMHWIRIDRYFKGASEDNPEAFIHAPVTCMHCENAPCEQVCPVAATEHDEQGLNVMVYNRCIGTRYCSNNCPYKVRRFNYFDYQVRGPLREQPGIMLQVEPDYYLKGQAIADPILQMQFNPEVTVRCRGVMEKCTYCVQRISAARIAAKNQWVNDGTHPKGDRVAPIKDGAVVPACAQACPAQAIVFGDLNDKNSRVAALQKQDRAYQMLDELNTKPRTKYQAKLRNPAFESPRSGAHGAGHGATHDSPDTHSASEAASKG